MSRRTPITDVGNSEREKRTGSPKKEEKKRVHVPSDIRFTKDNWQSIMAY